MFNRIQALVITVLCAGLATKSFAIGGAAIGNEVPSARGAGQGYVGTAGQNDDPAAVYVNPAAMTSLKGTQISAGLTWENLHGQYENNTGSKTKMRSNDVVVPNVSVTHGFMDGKLAAGLAIESPYGLETYWPGTSPLRYVATNSKLHIVDITPAVAYKVHEMISIGAGVDYFNAFDAALEKHLNESNINTLLTATPTSSPDANSKLSGTGANWGFHTGVMIEPSEHHSFGITYHSKVKLRLNGSVSLTGLTGASAAVFGGSDYSTGANTTLYLPQNVQFGYAYKPTDKWTFEADTAWTDWYSARDLNVQYAEKNATRLAVLTNFGAGNPQPLNWRDAWSFATGANYKYSDKVQLRTGFWYEPYAAPESTFSPAFMDLSRYGAAIGAGYAITSALSVDVAYNAIFFHTRHITNNTGFTTTGDPTANPNGTYKNFTNLIALNFIYKHQ